MFAHNGLLTPITALDPQYAAYMYPQPVRQPQHVIARPIQHQSQQQYVNNHTGMCIPGLQQVPAGNFPAAYPVHPHNFANQYYYYYYPQHQQSQHFWLPNNSCFPQIPLKVLLPPQPHPQQHLYAVPNTTSSNSNAHHYMLNHTGNHIQAQQRQLLLQQQHFQQQQQQQPQFQYRQQQPRQQQPLCVRACPHNQCSQHPNVPPAPVRMPFQLSVTSTPMRSSLSIMTAAAGASSIDYNLSLNNEHLTDEYMNVSYRNSQAQNDRQSHHNSVVGSNRPRAIVGRNVA